MVQSKQRMLKCKFVQPLMVLYTGVCSFIKIKSKGCRAMTSLLMYISIHNNTDLDLCRRTLKCKFVQPLMELYTCMKFH